MIDRAEPMPDVGGRDRLGPALGHPVEVVGQAPVGARPPRRAEAGSRACSRTSGSSRSPARRRPARRGRDARGRRAGCSAGTSRRSSGGRLRRTCSATSTASVVEPGPGDHDHRLATGEARPEHARRRGASARTAAPRRHPAGHLAGRRRQSPGPGSTTIRRRSGPPGRRSRTASRSRARPPDPTPMPPRWPGRRSTPRARPGGCRGLGIGSGVIALVGRSVIGRATPRRNGNGPRGPCFGNARSVGRPGRTRSVRPGGRARPSAGPAGPLRRR